MVKIKLYKGQGKYEHVWGLIAKIWCYTTKKKQICFTEATGKFTTFIQYYDNGRFQRVY